MGVLRKRWDGNKAPRQAMDLAISALLELAGVDCSEKCDIDNEQVVFAIRLANFKTMKGPTSKHAVLLKKLVNKVRFVSIGQPHHA
jgi:hypothetical protein